MKLRMFVLIAGALVGWTVASQAALLVRYTFDEASSGTTDALNVGGTVVGANGVFNGSSTRSTDTPGNFSTAAMEINPNGSVPYDDYVGPTSDHDALDALSAMTVTMWLKVEAAFPQAFHPLAGDFTSPSAGWIFYYVPTDGTDTAQTLGFEVDGSAITADANIDASGDWLFIAAAWDGTNVRFYSGSTNSAASQVGTDRPLSLSMTGNSAAMRVASYGTGAFAGPDGLLDDFRVYTDVFDASALDAIRLENLPAVIPEPSTVILMFAGAGLIWRRRKMNERHD